MSDELVDRLSHLVEDDTSSCAVCQVEILENPVSMDLLGWQSTDRAVTIEVPPAYLSYFFDQHEPICFTLFGQRYNATMTDANCEKGSWIVRLYF